MKEQFNLTDYTDVHRLIFCVIRVICEKEKEAEKIDAAQGGDATKAK